MSDAPKPNVHQRLRAAIQGSGAVAKSGQAAQSAGGYQYHKIDDVVDHLREIIINAGLTILPSVSSCDITEFSEPRSGGGERRVYHAKTMLSVDIVNVDDPSDKITIQSFGDGIDYGDKSSGKAFSYALKTILLGVFQLRGQPDNEADDHDHGVPQQASRQRTTQPPPAPKTEGKPVPSMADRKKAPWAVPNVTSLEAKIPDWRQVMHHKYKPSGQQEIVPTLLGELPKKVVEWWCDNWPLPMNPAKEDVHLRVALNIARKEFAIEAAGESQPEDGKSWPPPDDQIPF